MSDWIKLRSELDTDPRIFAMGEKLRLSAQSYILTQRARDLFGDVTDTVTRDVMRDVTLAALTRVWFAANRHTTDGVFHNATLDYLDTLAQVAGFGEAMQLVGYAIHDPEARTVTLPRFGEYNSPNKNGQRGKSKSAERQARYRENKRLEKQTAASDSAAPAAPPAVNDGPKEKESNVTSDVTRDVTPSISFSSSSKSTKGTLSESEKVGTRCAASDSDAPASLPPSPDPDPDPLGTLKKRINALRPAWTKAPHWSAEEESALFEARHNLLALEGQDWLLLAWFFKFANSAANTSQRDAVPVTTRRHQFVRDLASYLDRATTAWKQNGSPKLGSDAAKPSPPRRGIPAPSTPPPTDRATSASFAASLAAHGAQLPPSRPTVADRLLSDLKLSPSPHPAAESTKPTPTSTAA